MNYVKLLDGGRPAVMPLQLDSCAALEAHAAKLSLMARPGMVILLEGELGAGKSTYARAFIKALVPGILDFDVPSPTFTLIQTYEETRIPVAHADLYRVVSLAESYELGLDDLVKSHVLIIEWPDRLPPLTWPDVLRISIAGYGGSRNLTLEAEGRWIPALKRSEQIDRFISGTQWHEAKRQFLEGDASSRRYEILAHASPAVILMDMPARPDGPPIRNGLSYSAIAHLAENISAVIAVNGELVRRGYSAPAVYNFDQDKGLAIIEDLGRGEFGRMIHAGADMSQPMAAAVEVLADIASQSWPSEAAAGGCMHTIHRYDQEAQLIEIDLLPSWFWPYRYDVEVSPEIRDEFIYEWSNILPLTHLSKPVWILRDYHSPNLLWLPDRDRLKRVGIVDTQDTLLGHPAYDLVSMLQDARVDIDLTLAEQLFEHYCGLRFESHLDRSEFAAAYAVLGAQRSTKILGIFARLSKRDGKNSYLQHIPRVSRHLENNLRHPILKGLKRWFDRHLPAVARQGYV